MPSHKQNTRVQASRFAMQPRGDVPRSAFDTSHGHKTTFNAGPLVPVFVDEVLPGDSLRLKMTGFGRLSTPIVPVMDNLYLESFFFFIPERLLWTNWERFMGQQNSPSDTTEFLTPLITIEVDNTAPGHLADYFGITLNGQQEPGAFISVRASPFRAYKLVWNEWFRDEDLVDPVTVDLDDGPDDPPTLTNGALLNRGKRHDYFTSARPWPQKPINAAAFRFGNTEPLVVGGAMTLPQAGAPVSGIGFPQGEFATPGNAAIRTTGGRNVIIGPPSWNTFDDTLYIQSNPSGTAADIRVLVNDIRTATLVQAMMERNARGGTRYTEILQAHFGVRSPDSRLQRPEYLGGGRSMITVNAVNQTTPSESETPLGYQGGTAQVVATDHGFSASFVEHGWILGLVNVRADLSYQNGINRMWFRRSPFDFYWPGLNGLGEQAILQKEVFTMGFPNPLVSDYDNQVFGYQERWSEYKYKPARISGFFRSANSLFTETLDYWHFSQEFDDTVQLDDAFVSENPPVDRVLQVDTTFGEQVLFDALFQCRWVRAMPMYSLPGLGVRL